MKSGSIVSGKMFWLGIAIVLSGLAMPNLAYAADEINTGDTGVGIDRLGIGVVL